MSKLEEMLVFTRVVDDGSFSKAARHLKLTPSAVSKQVSRLEDRLDVRLLNRTTRRLSVTEEGRAFYERCLAILAEVEEAEWAVSELKGTPRGTLRVIGSVAFTKHQVVPIIPEFLSRHPSLRLELELTDRPVELIEDGVDVGIQLTEQPEPGVIARRLAANRRVIVASPGYLRRHGIPGSPEDLQRHNCLTLSAVASFNDWEFEDAERGKRVLRVAGRFEANHADALYEAVLAGVGLARLATFLVGPDLAAGRLVSVLPEYTHEKSSIYVIYPHRRHLSSKVRAFVDYLVENFTPSPPWETHP